MACLDHCPPISRSKRCQPAQTRQSSHRISTRGTRMFRKLCLSAAAMLAATLCMGGSAHPASGPSGNNQLDRLQPLVQPSVVYETIKWKAQIWDTHNKQYIPTKV